MKPQVQYTKSGNINIAYQVFGSGPIDLVYIPGWISNIDWMWACPELVAFFEELGKIARVVLFDKRGTGLSDRVVELSTLEERMDDIKAVMDAIGSEKAILFGHSEGGSVSALFSATYPDRVIALMAFGIFAKRKFSTDYPWAPTEKERQKVYDMIEKNWGSGQMNLESLVPSKANDRQFMDWLASYFRSGASPEAAMKLTKMNTHVNIIDILGSIKVPTLIMQRTNDIDVKIEEGKFISDRINGSKFVEFDGDDHLFWIGNTGKVLDEMKVFIKKLKPCNQSKKGISTVLFTEITSPFKSKIKKEIINHFTNHCTCELKNEEKNSFILSFKVPGKAVQCSLDIQKVLQDLKINFRIGIYIKEGCTGPNELLSKRDLYMIQGIQSQLKQNQILATQTIKHLLSGSDFNFTEHSSILDEASPELCKLYTVSKTVDTENIIKANSSFSFSQYNSFLEDVLQTIYEYLDDSSFNVEKLTRKIGVSERQLQRKIKNATGKSPSQLITSVRLQKAKSALLFRNDTIAEIAFQFGFSSPSYFSKCFKKEFGISPNLVINNE